MGVTEPAHTQAELAAYRERSSEAITIDGHTRTRYQWTQQMRRIETAVRRQKDIAVAAKAAGDMTARREAQKYIDALQETYSRITEAADLAKRTDLMTVSGFRAVKAVEALADSEKFKNAAFESDKVYARHISKHLEEYGSVSEDEYIRRAQKLLQSSASEDIMVLTRSDGSVSKYRISTNEFAVGTKDGNIRTAFKPKEGFQYWRNEIERNR